VVLDCVWDHQARLAFDWPRPGPPRISSAEPRLQGWFVCTRGNYFRRIRCRGIRPLVASWLGAHFGSGVSCDRGVLRLKFLRVGIFKGAANTTRGPIFADYRWPMERVVVLPNLSVAVVTGIRLD
jgi:hypothetical protein